MVVNLLVGMLLSKDYWNSLNRQAQLYLVFWEELKDYSKIKQ